ncbi:hypothetical protein D3C80_1942520 [compost metagenome]
MQEGVGLAPFDRVVARQRRFDVGELVFILGVFEYPVERDGFHRCEDFMGAVLAQGVAKEAAHVVGRGVEHG